jgi:RHS repeat-associated protein
MFALKPGKKIAIRIGLLAALIFGAIAPGSAYAKSPTVGINPTELSSETAGVSSDRGPNPSRDANAFSREAVRPKRDGVNRDRSEKSTALQSPEVTIQCVNPSSYCSDTTPNVVLTETFDSYSVKRLDFRIICSGTGCSKKDIFYSISVKAKAQDPWGPGSPWLWTPDLYARARTWESGTGGDGTGAMYDISCPDVPAFTIKTCEFSTSGSISAEIISGNPGHWSHFFVEALDSINGSPTGTWTYHHVEIKVSLYPLDGIVPVNSTNCKGGIYYCPVSEFAGDPINTRTGVVSYEENDLKIQTSTGELQFNRTYISSLKDSYTTPLGYGWVHNQDVRLIFPSANEPGFVEFKDPSGNIYQFWYAKDAATGAERFTPYSGYTAALVKNAGSPVTYTLTDQFQMVYSFDAGGKVTTITNPTGHAINYLYDLNGRLEQVSADAGLRFLEFNYEPAGRLASVDDHTGRSVTFTYDANGDLTGYEDVLGNLWNYEYAGHLLTRVVDPDTNTVVRNEYLPDGRAWKQFDGEDHLVAELQYSTVNPIPGPSYAFDFESGDLTGWTIQSGTAFSPLDVTNQYGFGNHNTPFNHQGTYHLLSNKTGDNSLTGILVSDTVTLPENASVQLLVSGGSFINTAYVALVRASDQAELFTATGEGGNLQDQYRRIVWNASAYAGEDVYIKLVDAETGGHINLDDVKIIAMPPSDAPVLATTVTDALGNDSLHEYDFRGTLVSEANPVNIQTQKTFDNNFRPLEISNSANQTLQMIWSADGANLLSKTDPLGNLTSYTYDALNNMTSVTDGRGFTTTHTYSGTLLTGTEDALGGDTTYTYTPEGFLESVTDTAGRVTSYTYDSFGQRISMTDPANNTWDYAYDSLGRLIDTTDPQGRVTHNEYDAAGRLIRVTQNYDLARPQNDQNLYNIVTEYAYDVRGNQVSVTDTFGRTTQYVYDDAERLLQTIDPAGNVTTNVYDAAGRLISTTDPLLHTTTYEYDAAGRLIKTINALGFHSGITSFNVTNNTSTVTDLLGRATVFHYDDLGRVIQVVDPLGNSTFTEYDGNGNVITRTDALGRTTEYEYDALNRLIRTIDPNGGVTETVYDASDNRAATIDPLGNQTTYTYDSAGRLVATTDPLDRITQTVYDTFGRRTATIDAAGNATTYTYDLLDRVITVTDAADNTTQTTYDALGNVLTRTDANGGATTTTYDSLNRPHILTDANGNQTTNIYDAGGNLIGVTDALGRTTTYTYDALNRRKTAADPEGSTTEWFYDTLGNVLDIENANGIVTHYEYDALNRQTAVILNYLSGFQPDSDTNVRYEFTYNAAGNRIAVEDPNGSVTTYGYDALNRVVQKVDPLGNTWSYTYDLAGRRISTTDAKNQTIQYTYDAAGQLIGIDYPGTEPDVTFSYTLTGQRIGMTDGLGATSWTYDELNRLISTTDPFDNTVQYGYDAVGNRTTLTYPDGKTVAYVYDDVNQLTGVTDWDNQAYGYSYDDAGQLTAISRPNGVSSAYSYNDAGRLLALEHMLGANTLASYNYTYDPAGNVIQAIENLIQPVSLPTPTPTFTDAPTETPNPTDTPTDIPTSTFTSAPTDTPIPTNTNSPTPAFTSTSTHTPTSTTAPAATDTATPTATSTFTPTPTAASSAAFPTTGILDNFNRANGSIGSNWSGNTAGYSISSNQLQVKTNNPNLDMYWNQTSFGPNQEVYFTFTATNATATDQDLILKAQSASGWGAGFIEVWYDAAGQRAQVWTFDQNQSWVQHGGDIPLSFAVGDQFGARALASGDVEVYKNGQLMGVRNVGTWPNYAAGGYIGVWFGNAKNVLLDNFGGGNAPGMGAAPQPDFSFKLASYFMPALNAAPFQQSGSATRVAYWKLEESASPWSDATGSGHDLSLAAGSVASISGKVENGLSNASNVTDLQTPSHTDFDFTLSEGFSIEAWARTSNNDDNWKILFGRRGASGGVAFKAGHWQEGMGFGVRTSTGQGTEIWYGWQPGNIDVNDGLWHHWVFFVSPTHVGIWLDGGLAVSEPHGFTSGDFTTTAPFYVLRETNEPNRWLGDVDEFAVYRGVLGEEEILDHYNNGIGKHYDEPLSTPTPINTATFTPVFTPTNTPGQPTPTFIPIPSGSLTIDYTYDALNRLTSATYSDGRSFNYTYDPAGNVLELQQDLGPGTVVTTYTYDAANQLNTAQQGDPSTGSGQAWQYTYDANGSLISDGVKTYTYDSANRLKTVTSNQSSVNLSYNGLGQRLSMDAAGVIAHYVMDGDRPLTAETGGNTNFYLYGLGAIGEKTTAWNFSLPDGTNTPRQLSDNSGEITLSARYTPWGDSLELHGTGNFSFGYLGGVLDAATGLLYVGNGQYYDPQTGRFLTRDVQPNSPNPYVPWNPIGAIVGPLGLIFLIASRRKKGGKANPYLLMFVMLVVLPVGIGIACNGEGPTELTAVVTPDGTATVTVGDITVVATVTPNPGSPLTPLAISCLTPLENVPSPTPEIEPWKTDPNYDPFTNSIPNWGSDNSEPGRLARAEKVYDWLNVSGGYWGKEAPNQDTLTAWLVMEEGSILESFDQENMAKGIRYRFTIFGFDDKQRSAYTAFLNPQRDNKFDDTDWKQLTSPSADISYYEGIVNRINQNPVKNEDGRYLYWFDKYEMDGAGTTTADLKRLGDYTTTTTLRGYQFYFTGIPNVFRCGTQGGSACNPSP